MFVKNVASRAVTIGNVMIVPGAVVELPEGESHKGVKLSLSKGWFVQSEEKEYYAYIGQPVTTVNEDEEAATAKKSK